jgi:hypothetical protein
VIELTYLETDEKFDIHVDCIRRLRETQELGSNLKVTVLITEDNSFIQIKETRCEIKRKINMYRKEYMNPAVNMQYQRSM